MPVSSFDLQPLLLLLVLRVSVPPPFLSPLLPSHVHRLDRRCYRCCYRYHCSPGHRFAVPTLCPQHRPPSVASSNSAEKAFLLRGDPPFLLPLLHFGAVGPSLLVPLLQLGRQSQAFSDGRGKPGVCRRGGSIEGPGHRPTTVIEGQQSHC